jgi:hypothetical protein
MLREGGREASPRPPPSGKDGLNFQRKIGASSRRPRRGLPTGCGQLFIGFEFCVTEKSRFPNKSIIILSEKREGVNQSSVTPSFLFPLSSLSLSLSFFRSGQEIPNEARCLIKRKRKDKEEK